MEKFRTRELKNYDEYLKEHGLTDFVQVASLFEGLGFTCMHAKRTNTTSTTMNIILFFSLEFLP